MQRLIPGLISLAPIAAFALASSACAEAETAISERVGSAATGIIGAIAVGVGVGSAAHTHTFNAANMFNDDAQGREVRAPGVPVYVSPPTSSLAGTHVAVYITPGPGYAPRPVEAAPVVPR
jgi:hypothetical protein